MRTNGDIEASDEIHIAELARFHRSHLSLPQALPPRLFFVDPHQCGRNCKTLYIFVNSTIDKFSKREEKEWIHSIFLDVSLMSNFSLNLYIQYSMNSSNLTKWNETNERVLVFFFHGLFPDVFEKSSNSRNITNANKFYCSFFRCVLNNKFFIELVNSIIDKSSDSKEKRIKRSLFLD